MSSRCLRFTNPLRWLGALLVIHCINQAIAQPSYPSIRAGGTPNEERIWAELEKPTEIDFVNTPLEQVFEFLADYHQIPILVNRRALHDVKMDPSKFPITGNAKNVSLGEVLKALLDKHELRYVIRNEVMMVTTERDTAGDEEMRVYSISELVDEPAGAEDLAETIAQQLGANDTGTDAKVKSGSADGTQLVDVQHPRIRAFGKLLLVRGTREVQQRVSELLLAKLRSIEQQK